MSESDAALAARAGVTVPVLKAIRAVESSGSASLIRFEPHKFLRERPDLAGRIPYTHPQPDCRFEFASCIGSETNRAAFDRAFALDPRVAVESTSWGTYQALGGKLLPLFGNDPARAVRGFYANPTQVSNDILVRWMNDNPRAVEAANAQDWFGFVKRYNGCCSGSTSTHENCRACDRYLARFDTAYREALAVAGGAGGLLLLAALGAGAWWYFRRPRALRGLGWKPTPPYDPAPPPDPYGPRDTDWSPADEGEGDESDSGPTRNYSRERGWYVPESKLRGYRLKRRR